MGNESFSEPVEKLQFLKCRCFCYSCMEVAALFELFAVNMTTIIRIADKYDTFHTKNKVS